MHPLMRASALMDYTSTFNATQPESSAAGVQAVALLEAEKNLVLANEKSQKRLAVVHMQLARLYQRKGERERAADELDQYLLTNPSAKNAEEIRDIIRKLRISADGPTTPAARPQ
jgi:D-alanyl-D-alanine carboxypeptidase